MPYMLLVWISSHVRSISQEILRFPPTISKEFHQNHISSVVMLTRKQEHCIVTLIGEFVIGWIKHCVGIFVELHRNPCRPPIEAQESSFH